MREKQRRGRGNRRRVSGGGVQIGRGLSKEESESIGASSNGGVPSIAQEEEAPKPRGIKKSDQWQAQAGMSLFRGRRIRTTVGRRSRVKEALEKNTMQERRRGVVGRLWTVESRLLGARNNGVRREEPEMTERKMPGGLHAHVNDLEKRLQARSLTDGTGGSQPRRERKSNTIAAENTERNLKGVAKSVSRR